MKYAHRQLFPSTQPRLSPYTFAPSPFSPRPTIAHRDFSSEHSPRRVHPISFLPPSPPPSKRNRSWTQHHVKNIDWPDYIVYPGIIEFARKYLHLLEGGKSFSPPLFFLPENRRTFLVSVHPSPFDSFINESRGETSSFCSQVRDDMAADGVEPLEEEIPHEDIIGRDYCRYNVKRPIAP